MLFRSLNDLSNALCDRFEQLGGIQYLEESITCSRQSLNLCPIGDPNRSVFLNNFAIAITKRFQQLGRMEDLEEAIICHRQALTLLPYGHPDRSSSLNNFASAVCTRFQQSGRMEDLEEGITCHRRALALRPHGHPDHSSSLNNLANCVSIRFKHMGRMEDLEEAITCHRQALALRPHGHPGRSMSLNNLALSVSTRFKQSRRHDDLLDALKYLSEAEDKSPTGHPFQSTFSFYLASIYLIQCDNVSESDERLQMMTTAFELFKRAADHSPASAKDRFNAAVTWARNAHQRKHPSAVHAYPKSLTLLGRRLILAPTIESQQNLLATVPKALAMDAASSSINRGEFKSAIELLEQGRAVLWSKLRGYRHPLDKLRSIDKELFDQFETLSGQLECLAMSVESRLSASESNMKRPSFSKRKCNSIAFFQRNGTM